MDSDQLGPYTHSTLPLDNTQAILEDYRHKGTAGTDEEKKRGSSATGNRTRISVVTGRNTNHYTITDFWCPL